MDTTEIDVRARQVLRAKYNRDGQWDFLGLSVVRGLLQPGCTACRAGHDRACRELAFLLHEHVNDPAVVVGLIEANGFCQDHDRLARDLAVRTYGDELKIVMLHEHLLRSLARRLRTDHPLPRVLAARQPCPVCVAVGETGHAAVEWLCEALAVPEVAALYAASDGLCLSHLGDAGQNDARLIAQARDALEAVENIPGSEHWLTGIVPERVVLLWCGLLAEVPTLLETVVPTCPLCRAAIAAEQRLLEGIAAGMVPSDPPCPRHLCQVRSCLAEGCWPSGMITLLAERARTMLAALAERPAGVQRLRFAVERLRSGGRQKMEQACPVCTEGEQAAAAALAGLSAAVLAEHGCLDHIALAGSLHPPWQAVLRDHLRARVVDLLDQIETVYRADRRAEDSYVLRLAHLADRLSTLRTRRVSGANRTTGIAHEAGDRRARR